MKYNFKTVVSFYCLLFQLFLYCATIMYELIKKFFINSFRFSDHYYQNDTEAFRTRCIWRFCLYL